MSRSILGHGYRCTASAGYVDDCNCRDLGNERIECDFCGKEIDLDETVVVDLGCDYHSVCYAQHRKRESEVENLTEADLLPNPPLDEVLEAAMRAVDRIEREEVIS